MAAGFPLAPGTTTEAVDAGGVPAEWVVAPESDPGRVVLYLHGGGYVVGSIRTHRALASHVSRAARARVLVPDYRLAPEHPHPAAVNDAVAAYHWLRRGGAAPARIAIAGDSAGGGLTVATLVALRDLGDPLPAAAVCISPWVDLEGLGESMRTRQDLDPMVKLDGLRMLAKHYLGNADPRTPLAAPLHADLRGLPPLLVQVGTAEALLDDSTRLAERARAAGVEVDLRIWDDMIHVWHMFAPMVPESNQALEQLGAFVRAHTA